MKLKIFAVVLAAVSALADPGDGGFTVDFAGGSAPAVQVYQANAKAFSVRLQNFGVAVNLSNVTPYAAWATARGAASMVTAACTVTTAEQGIFRAVWTPADLNTNGAFFYEVGLLVNGTPVTARQGQFTILPDFYAAGASALRYMTRVDWDTIINAGTVPWPTNSGGSITGAYVRTVNGSTGDVTVATTAQGLLASTAVQPSSLTNYATLTAFNAQAQDVADLHSQGNILNTGKLDIATWLVGSNTLATATYTASTNASAAYSLAGDAYELARTNNTGATGGPQSQGIMPDGSTNAFGTASLLNSNFVATLVHNDISVNGFSLGYDGGQYYNHYIQSVIRFDGTKWIYMADGTYMDETAGNNVLGPWENGTVVNGVPSAITDASGTVLLNPADITRIDLVASNALAMATTNSATLATFGDIVTHNASEFATWGATNSLVSTGTFWNALHGYVTTNTIALYATTNALGLYLPTNTYRSTGYIVSGPGSVAWTTNGYVISGALVISNQTGSASSGTNGIAGVWTNGAGVVTASINPATGNFTGGTFNGATMTQQLWCIGHTKLDGGSYNLASNAWSAASSVSPQMFFLPPAATNIYWMCGTVGCDTNCAQGLAISNLCLSIGIHSVGATLISQVLLSPTSNDWLRAHFGQNIYQFSHAVTNTTIQYQIPSEYLVGTVSARLYNRGFAGPITNISGSFNAYIGY